MPKCTDNASPLRFTVNGQPMTLQAQTLAELLRLLDLRDSAVVAEVNGHVVPRESFVCFSLKEGDKVELVRFVGGG